MRRRRIGAYGLCRDGGGRIVLVRSGPGTAHAGLWHLPGGGVDHGEHPAGTVVREFAEETGLAVMIVRLLDVDLSLYRVERDQLVHSDRVTYEVTAVGGELRPEPDGSCDAVGWFSPHELAELPVTAATWRALGAGQRVGGLDPAEYAALAAQAAAPVAAGVPTRVQRFAAYGLASDPTGRYLLTRIAPGYPGEGSWHLPGGGTDFGESAMAGLAREIAEETGQIGAVGELLHVEDFHNPAAYGPERIAIDWHTVRSVFRVTVIDPTPPEIHDTGGSTDRASWLTLAEVRELPLNQMARTVFGRYAS